MIRLSYQVSLEDSVLVSWLQLMHKYFHDLLLKPLKPLESNKNDCLEGSPFLVTVCDVGINSMSSCHLQRLAVFLLLRCSFSLLSSKSTCGEQCALVNATSCLSFDQNLDLECCSKKKGLSKLQEWLQWHLPADMFVSQEIYLENCTSFSLSFLQLYMHEDDILFKMLMQLFCIPAFAKRQVCDKKKCWGAKGDILLHVSNLFNPIHLFHLFLAEILYDHQVLLDYLISKDNGASSAEYLLRCLRMVCDSWNEFVEFSLDGEAINNSLSKKRKFNVDGYSQRELSSASVKDDNAPRSLEKDCHIEHIYGSKLPFDAAKDCLLSLKRSLQNLHQKNLFPYNPGVLLQRLARFEKFCLKQ